METKTLNNSISKKESIKNLALKFIEDQKMIQKYLKNEITLEKLNERGIKFSKPI